MKKVIINRAISGSGKSTFSNYLVNAANEVGLSTSICNTDSYFIDKDGNYVFDASKLGYYHTLNYRKFCQDIDNGLDIIIVDNTNLKDRDFKQYTSYPKSKGYVVIEVVFLPDTAEVHYNRNLHALPMEAINRMLGAFSSMKIPSGHTDYNFVINPEQGPHSDHAKEIIKNIIEIGN